MKRQRLYFTYCDATLKSIRVSGVKNEHHVPYYGNLWRRRAADMPNIRYHGISYARSATRLS